MLRTCRGCQTQFEIRQTDLHFLEQVGLQIGSVRIPAAPPGLCPQCRAKRRFAFRNFLNLHHRRSSRSGKKLISMYAEDVPFPVYDIKEWWGDDWDPLSYGRRVDDYSSFFSQFERLYWRVPRMNMANTLSENSDYCNFSLRSKNCFLVAGNIGNEDCCYGHIVWQSTNCIDCLYVYRSELCCECTDCASCYKVLFSLNCENCSDSSFLINCFGCRNCIGCVGLRNREYCVFNEQLSQADYHSTRAKLGDLTRSNIDSLRRRTEQLLPGSVVKYYHGLSCENSLGDYLYNSRNVFECFDLKNCEDCRYSTTVESFRDCYDCSFSPVRTELSYECLFVNGYHLVACHSVANDSANLFYCDNCFACNDCFGCVGLKNMRFCVLNRQYSQEEYERLVPQIVGRMMEHEEWTEFFPERLTPFGYNETMAYEYFPLTREEAVAEGYRWRDCDPSQFLPPTCRVPERIADVSSDILKAVLSCSECSRNYRIIEKELNYYRDMSISPPELCFWCRHRRRMSFRNPRVIWQRECESCRKPVGTSYGPQRPEKVYCEECYLKIS